MTTDLFPIYAINPNNSARFLLGTEGEKTLLVIGLNPSTATKEKSDPTITKVQNFAIKNGYNSFVMINLYPQRKTFPSKLHKRMNTSLQQENISHIIKFLTNNSKFDLLASWGNNITLRSFLTICGFELWKNIKPFISKTYKIGQLTKPGHPRHPSRTAYNLEFTDFDIEKYFCI